MLQNLEYQGYKLARFNDEEEPRIASAELAGKIEIDPIYLKKRIRRYMADGELINTRQTECRPQGIPANLLQSEFRDTKSQNLKKDLGGRPEMEYYLCEHDALFTIVKSGTPIANRITHEVIDVFIAARKGLLPAHPVTVFNEQILARLDRQDEILRILAGQSPVNIIPSYKEMPMTIHRGHPGASRLGPAFQYPEGVEMVMSMRGRGDGFLEIEKASKERWPDEPERHITKSAAHRFWTRAKDGLLKEFGIDVTVH